MISHEETEVGVLDGFATVSTTPRKIHASIIELCNRIVAGTYPLWIPVVPESDAQINECFHNVNLKIARSGGSLKYGWCIWELPGLFLEAEHHGVWRSPAGHIVDVSPKHDGESVILFLEDDSAVFDELTFQRRDNVRMATKDHPAVHNYIKCAAKFNALLEKSKDPGDPRRLKTVSGNLATLWAEKIRLQMEMQKLKPGRNDMCRCGSTLKYKKCCGRRRT